MRRLVHNHEDQHIKNLEERLSYFDEIKDSLSQSVWLPKTAERVKQAANDRSNNIIKRKADEITQHVYDEAKYKANEILRQATDNAKRSCCGNWRVEGAKSRLPPTFSRQSKVQLAVDSSGGEEVQLVADEWRSFQEVVREVLGEDVSSYHEEEPDWHDSSILSRSCLLQAFWSS